MEFAAALNLYEEHLIFPRSVVQLYSRAPGNLEKLDRVPSLEEVWVEDYEGGRKGTSCIAGSSDDRRVKMARTRASGKLPLHSCQQSHTWMKTIFHFLFPALFRNQRASSHTSRESSGSAPYVWSRVFHAII